MSTSKSFLNPDSAELYSLKFPKQKSVRIRRDLKHFEEWLKAVANIETSFDDAVFHASLYKIFFLYNVALYPTSKVQENFIPPEFSLELQQQGLTDSGSLSCSQAASRIMTAIRWQQYHLQNYELQYYRPKIDTYSLMNELIPFYRKLRELVKNGELTYKKATQPETVFKVFKRREVPGPHSIRDLVILMLTWNAGCTPTEIVNFSFQNLELRGALDWAYHRPDKQGIEPVKLDPYTVIAILELVGTQPGIPSGEKLLYCFDDDSARPFSENEIEIILERHYRFAEALYGFDPYISIDADDLELDYSPSEEDMMSDMLTLFYDAMIKNPGQPHSLSLDVDDDIDWDVAVQRTRKGQREKSQPDAGDTPRDDSDDQADWDSAVIKRKDS
ncbi:hypothetical protein [Pseudomonas moorei]|uniref:hypothetical protein n=1 Tax=Pseudomonas moorei TaxID=395599 RepID=UPI0036F3613D